MDERAWTTVRQFIFGSGEYRDPFLGGWWRWALVSPDGVAPSRMVGVSASVNLPWHHKVQKFSSGTSSPGWSRKKCRKTVVVWCGSRYATDLDFGLQLDEVCRPLHDDVVGDVEAS